MKWNEMKLWGKKDATISAITATIHKEGEGIGENLCI